MLGRLRDAVDRFQQRTPPVAFLYGVLKKFGEDRAGQQAALLAYFGFFSLFPLLLVAVTLLAIVLRDNPHLREQILDSALTQFPIIGAQIKENIHGIAKGGFGLAIGIAGALWGGLGGLKALQNAMDHVWDVPVRRQANTVRQIARASMMLGVLLAFAIVSTGLSSLGTVTSGFGVFGRILLLLLGVGVNFAVFLIVYKLLTVADVTWRDVAAGAAFAAVGWSVLQSVGNVLVDRQLTNASELYGFFGIVLGLLSWMYLGAQLALYGAEINVVIKTHAWPRSLSSNNLTEADRRIFARYAEAEERVPNEDIETTFSNSGDAVAPRRTAPRRAS